MLIRTEKKNAARKLTEQIVLSLHKRHLEGEPIVSLAKEVNVTRRTLRLRFIAANLNYIRLRSNVTTDRRYFKDIDSELKAYLIGFIAADGSIYKGRNDNTLSIDIQERDGYLLEWIKQNIAPNNKITGILEKGNQVARRRISLSSYHLIKDLEDKGIIANKSKYSFIFKNIPQELQRHVVRGLLDGDGCIYKYKTGRLIADIVSTSIELLEQVQGWLAEDNIKATLQLAGNNGTQVYRLGVYSKDSIDKLREYLYSNSEYYLTRKHNKLCCDNTELTSKSKDLLAV